MSTAFARNLSTYRKLAGFTQDDLAKFSGTSRSSVNNYERGVAEPSFELLCAFSRVLGVGIVDLLTEHDIAETTHSAMLTNEEEMVIQRYRAVPEVYKRMVRKILEGGLEG